MTMIELPLATRSQKVVQEMETKDDGSTYGIRQEVRPRITETILGTRRSISVSVDGIQGVRVCHVRRVGAQFITSWGQYSDSPMGPDNIYESRSHILLPDGH
jgi:hypothetical protein